VVKRRFYNQLRFQIQRSLEQGQKVALLMMDLDGLKQINDTHGHAMGAHVISQAGRRIGEVVNPLGQACRYGGDEFVAYLLRHDLAAGLEVGERIRSAIRDHPFEKDGKVLKVSISIGVAVLPDAGREAEELSKAADEALYRAKARGRNCVSG
jgi:two-component system cell cycle response regulator